MATPKGFLLTFRTYGTWLHGDERGSVDTERNCPGTPLIAPAEHWRNWQQARLAYPPMVFDAVMRACVNQAIHEECMFRCWGLVQVNVRTNHAHVVLLASDTTPERMLGHLKSRSTRMLRRQGLATVHQPVWADGVGSRRYLWTDEHLRTAEAYVREGQDTPR